MTALFDNHASISKGLQKLAHGESMPWTELSCLLDQVDKTGYWEQTANSFTDWLKSNAEKLGNKESTLWRYLVVGRYYHDLREQFARVQLEYPPLLELPKHVSPEKLELLSKLGRVAPKDFFEKLIYDVLDNEVTRDDIREQWKAFRPALMGKTARGRKVEAPTVNINNEDEFKTVTEAIIINSLKSLGSEWLGSTKALMYDIRMDVWSREPDYYPGISPMFRSVAIYKKDKQSELEIHGIDMDRCFLSEKFSFIVAMINDMSTYCDFFWMVIGTATEHYEKDVPRHIGLLNVNQNRIKVVRQATSIKKDNEKANILLKELLFKETRK